MLRKSIVVANVFFALLLMLACQSRSLASTVSAYCYIGTATAPRLLYMQTQMIGDPNIDWWYITDGNWWFNALDMYNLQVTTVNGIVSVSLTMDGYLNDNGQAVLVTYKWISYRSVNSIQVKMVDYYTGKVVNGIDSTKTPYTSVTGFYSLKP